MINETRREINGIEILIGDDMLAPEEIKLFEKRVPELMDKCNFTYVNTPREILEMIKTRKWDCIVTDLNYTRGGMEGYAILQEVKECTTVRILWTSDVDEKPEVVQKGIEAGATCVIEKHKLGERLKELYG